MILLIKNIPFAVTLSEFRVFLENTLNSCISLPAESIKKSELMVLYDKQRGEFEFYGLIHFYSSQSGQLAMQKINETNFNGCRVNAREFFIRKSDALTHQAPPSLAVRRDQRRIKNEQLMVFSSYEHIEVPGIETVKNSYW
jgi:hypothetical protein